MNAIFNTVILILLLLIFYKIFGSYGIAAALAIFIIFLILVELLTSKINNKDFEEMDLSEINLCDILFYKVFGGIFLRFRKKNEVFFDNLYFNFRHFIVANVKVYTIIFFFSIAVIISLISINQKINNDLLAQKADEKKMREIVNVNIVNNDKKIKNDNIIIKQTGIVNNKEESIIFKQHIILTYKKRYGNEWKAILLMAINYYKDKNINNDFTKSFIKEDGSIDVNDEE